MKNFLQIFTNRKMFAVFILGFSCGLPLVLTGATLQAWMTSEKVDLKVVGLFSLVGLPYTIKFLWSPLMDRFVPPFLGRRRGWMLICQLLIAVAIAMMAFINPVEEKTVIALLAFMVAFFSASQDIVVDAYQTELLLPEQRGVASGLYVMGYRLAMIIAGACALIMSDHMSWRSVYLIMAAIMSVGIIGSLSSPEPTIGVRPPRNFKESVIDPFVDYFRRRGALEVLAFIILYKLGDVLAAAMTTPFMIQIGFTKTEIGAVTKGVGVAATIVGALFGGALMVRMSLYRALVIFGVLQSITILMFFILARVGHNTAMMAVAIAIENLSGGMGTAALGAFIMGLCNQKFTATQYSLLTSVMALSRIFIGAPTGFVAQSFGWEMYFVICTLCAVPGMLLLIFRFHKWYKLPTEEPAIVSASS